MADLYGLEASGIDPEIAAKLLGVKGKRAIAQALLDQSMQGLKSQPTPAGGFAVPISPLEGITQMAKAYMGRKKLDSLDSEQVGLATENQRRVADAMQGYEKTRSGAPEAPPMVANDDEGNRMPNVAATAGNPRAAIVQALSNPMTAGNPLVKADMGAMEKASQPYILPAGAQRFSADNKPLAAAGFKPERAKAPMNDFQIAQLKEMIMKGADIGMDVSSLQAELQSALAGRAALNGPPQMPTPAPAGPAGIPPAVLAAAQTGKPFVATQAPGQEPQFQTPPASGLAPRDQRHIQVTQAEKDIDTKTKQKDRENIREFGMQGLGDTIAQAEKLLDSKPTGSGVGTVYDSVASIFGKTPAGANEAQALKAVGGALVSKMPRMQGPQSDKDVMLYTQMAAQVGDSTVPAERRKAALQEVKRLWSKYEGGTPAPATPEAPTTPPTVADLLKKYGKPNP